MGTVTMNLQVFVDHGPTSAIRVKLVRMKNGKSFLAAELAVPSPVGFVAGQLFTAPKYSVGELVADFGWRWFWANVVFVEVVGYVGCEGGGAWPPAVEAVSGVTVCPKGLASPRLILILSC